MSILTFIGHHEVEVRVAGCRVEHAHIVSREPVRLAAGRSLLDALLARIRRRPDVLRTSNVPSICRRRSPGCALHHKWSCRLAAPELLSAHGDGIGLIQLCHGTAGAVHLMEQVVPRRWHEAAEPSNCWHCRTARGHADIVRSEKMGQGEVVGQHVPSGFNVFSRYGRIVLVHLRDLGVLNR